MRVAFFTDTFLPTTNGVVSGVMNFSQGLSELGCQVLVVAPKDPRLGDKKLKLSKGIEVIWLRSVDGRIYPDLRLGLLGRGSYKKVKEFDPDVIHVFTPATVGMAGIAIAKRLKKPLVFTHGTRFDDKEMLRALKLTKLPIMKLVQRTSAGSLTRRVLNMVDVVLVTSSDTLKKVKKLGVKRNFELVPIPVPVDRLRIGKGAGLMLKKKYGIKRALISVGRLSGEKRVDVIIRVFAELVDEFKDLKLVLVGGGPQERDLRQLAGELGVKEKIIWTGEKRYDELVERGYFFLGDVMMMMSQVETQGLTSVEAMACGLVVVGANKGATPEVIGDAGVLVNSSNERQVVGKVRELLKNDELMRQIKGRALKRAEEFSIESCSEKLVGVYEDLLTRDEK